MNWGKAITLTFIAFAGFIGTMVYWMCQQRVDLVRDDYYQSELAHQKHIDRVSNAARLTNLVNMTYLETEQQLAFALPTSLRRGTITFYRPADRQQDFRVSIPNAQTTSRRTLVPTSKLARGHWRVQISWTDGQRDYYTENEVFL
ncbi:FixH family protein [Spirosoma montaniterrae]|uniref:Nitrogen fixation protein FixH n=1 Tax=Spirosoma montaniterrae TaxID=1178516 RepID=A0A1P9WU46_9BACT|nr:FixH family protein [Spirosoma montaniterrae]AQG78915.1 nitrogen fixation protein FixH [Spirosoma montaniterrae]